MFTLFMILSFIGILVIILIAQIVAYRKLNQLKKRFENEVSKTTKTEELKRKFLQKKQRIKTIKSIVMILPVIAMAVYFITKESTGQDALLVVVKENEKYVYHNEYIYLLKDIENANYPNIEFYSKVKIYPIGGSLYIEPTALKHFANLLAGDLVYMDYKTEMHRGFVASKGGSDYYQLTQRNIPTKDLGEIEKEFTVTIELEGKSINVIWAEGKEHKNYRAIRNCEMHEVYYVSGKYGTTHDELLVNVTELIKYLNPEVSISFDNSAKVLYWKSN